MSHDKARRSQSRLRSRYDREIFSFAVPALGALAAEPLYVLVGTAIVGHLGRDPLAALGISAAVLTGVVALCNFLAYATTGQIARATGAGDRGGAHAIGAQALWLSLALGLAVAGLTAGLAPQLVAALGGKDDVADLAVSYLRITSLGLPFALVAIGGQGYLRGVADLRYPLAVLVAGNVLNGILAAVLVYAFDLGIEGAAWATVIAQAAMGAGFVGRIVRSAHGHLRLDMRRLTRLLGVSRYLFVRTLALYVTFVVASAVAARVGTSSIAAHQVVLGLWTFLALVLDAIAIAGQVIVGRALGSGNTDEAYSASRRMIALSVAAGAAVAAALVALWPVLPHAFTGDAEVLDRIDAIWLVFALMQPLNGAAFALDGILIGAGDARFLMWGMVGACALAVGLTLVVLPAGWGLLGVWSAISLLVAARVALFGARFQRRRWLVTGWHG